jgi:hypothetical protein
MKPSTFTTIAVVLSIGLVACGDDSGGSGTGGGGTGGSSTSSQGGAGGGSTSTQGGGGAGGGGVSDSCDTICARYLELEAELSCGYDDPSCVTTCRAAFAADPECEASGVALNDCLVELEVTDWQCAGGNFAWGAGLCQDEYDAAVACQTR